MAVALAGFFRGLTGFGFALAAVPLLTCFISPAQAAVTVILLQCFVGFRDIVILRSEIDRKSVRRLSIGAVVGTGPGIFLLTWLNQDVMRVSLLHGSAFGRSRPVPQ